MKLVSNPIENWQQMAGATELQQKLNALLTERLIASEDIPADECLSEAEMLETKQNEKTAREFLVGTFATTAPEDGSEPIERYVPICKTLAKEIQAVRRGQWPPT
ncbi:MAG: hypothetical protein A2Y38_02235 [Spirochaetes bacterium GWB1_59_5]|nr:MAG: hypothetical protein A2Y38_02235 [Spirochaetes bacterium GWB1_59_5]